jgi:hypothetical protein
MHAKSTLTKECAVDRLMAELAARRRLATQRDIAYMRLAQHILTTDRAGRRKRAVSNSATPVLKIAA